MPIDEPPTLDILSDLVYGVWKATVFKAALELDLFTVIAGGHQTLHDVVAATQCSERGIRRLLDALCSLGLLGKSEGRYALTPTSEAFLVRGKPSYKGDYYVRYSLAWQARARIAEGVKTGMAVNLDASRRATADLWASYCAPSLVTWPREAEEALATWKRLGIDPDIRPGLQLLDVACGAGVMSFVLARDDANVRITAFDSSEKVLEVVAHVAEAMEVKEQVTFHTGDVVSADFGTEQFEIVLFGRILPYFSLSQIQHILQRAHTALKPGGLVVINSLVVDEERCQAEGALVGAFELLLYTSQSDNYTFSEYQSVLLQAGFIDVTQHSDAYLRARKPM